MRKVLFSVIVVLVWIYAEAYDTNYEALQPLPLVEKNEASLALTKNGSCGQNITKASGSFNLAVANLNERVCYWILQPNITNGTATVNLFLHTLFLHHDDILTLHKTFEDAENDSFPLIEPIRAQNGSLTIITEESTVVLKLQGNDTTFLRKFEGTFHSPGCDFPLIPTLQIIHSPIHSNLTKSYDCEYTYNKEQHKREIPVFFFEEYNYTERVGIEGSTLDGFSGGPPTDFFPLSSSKTMTLKVHWEPEKSKGSYKLRMRFVDSNCSGLVTVKDQYPVHLMSPAEILDNGTLVMECRWVIQHIGPKVLGLTFETLNFANVLDVVAINNGLSEISPPLMQITTSNKNLTKKQEIRTSAQSMWISFKPDTYASVVSAHVTVHEQGGYHQGSGKVSLKGPSDNDIVLLEVDSDKVVSLNFVGDIASSGMLKIYDNFNYDNMLASLQGKIWYPVLSKSSRMMIVPENLTSSNFDISFEGTNHSCVFMSTLSADSYVLSGNCNTSCLWVIPPQNIPNYVMLLDLQHISLKKGDRIEIYKADSNKTHLGTITESMNFVPQLVVPASVGAVVNVTQAQCKKEDETVVLIGHSSYIPGCGKALTPNSSETFQISSPRYPDTYPIFANCQWSVSVSKNILHLSFQSLKLAENHCITVTQNSNSYQFSGHQLPDDLFLNGDTIINFDSTYCNKSKNSEVMVSDEGFVLNGTIADCGSIFDGKTSGEFNTSLTNNQKYCVWKIKVPANDGSTVNIISYTITKTDNKENYELHVYDGASVRDSAIVNSSKSDIWSRTNNLIFIYKRLNVSQPSSAFVIKYNIVGCNETMQCDNKVCLHPDWRCNGINECLDFTDERNCASVPIPPDVTLSGYSSVAFWITAFAMLIIGIILTISIPYFYQKYKNGQYRRFGEISVIE